MSETTKNLIKQTPMLLSIDYTIIVL